MKLLPIVVAICLLVTGCSSKQPSKVTSNPQVQKESQTNTHQATASTEKQTLTKLAEFKGTINTMGNTNGNLNGQGIVAQEGNRVYFSDGKKLYVANNSDLNQRQLLDQVQNDYELINNLNVVNNVLYYVKADDIWSIHADGTNKKQLSEKAGVNRMMVWQDKIIYIGFYNNEKQRFKCNRLYIMNLDGSNKRLLSGEANNVGLFNVENNELFYTIDARDEPVQVVLSYTLDPKDTASYDQDNLAGGVRFRQNEINSLLVKGNKLYYTDSSIMLADWGGENPKTIRVIGGTNLNIVGQDLYFVDVVGPQPTVDRMFKDGGETYQPFLETAGAYMYGIADNKLFALVQKGQNYNLKIIDLKPIDYTASGTDSD